MYKNTKEVNSGNQVTVNAYKHLDWQPEWDEKRFLASIEEEIDDALKFDTITPTVFKAFKEGRGETVA